MKRIRKELKDKEEELKQKHKDQIEKLNSKKQITFGGIQLNSTFSQNMSTEDSTAYNSMNIEETVKFKYKIGPKALHTEFDFSL